MGKGLLRSFMKVAKRRPIVFFCSQLRKVEYSPALLLTKSRVKNKIEKQSSSVNKAVVPCHAHIACTKTNKHENSAMPLKNKERKDIEQMSKSMMNDE